MKPNGELSAEEILASCQASFAPVNARPVAAVSAYKLAVGRRQPESVRWLALTSIVLSGERSVDDIRLKLDYLATIPENDWPPSPAPFCDRREATLDMLRRAIGWQNG